MGNVNWNVCMSPSSKTATLGVQEWDYPGSCSPYEVFHLHIPDTSTSGKQSTNGQWDLGDVGRKKTKKKAQ